MLLLVKEENRILSKFDPIEREIDEYHTQGYYPTLGYTITILNKLGAVTLPYLLVANDRLTSHQKMLNPIKLINCKCDNCYFLLFVSSQKKYSTKYITLIAVYQSVIPNNLSV